MSFISAPTKHEVQGYGPTNAKIVLVGEALGAEEAKQGKPFVGPAGTVLEQCLHAAGLTRSECYITNVVKVKPYNNDIGPYIKIGTQGRYSWSEQGMAYVKKLHAELDTLQPNVVVALGAVAMAALTNNCQVMKMRGYVMEGYNGLKVIPTIHPAASLRGQYIYRYIISGDLRKAGVESEHPDIRRPKRNLIHSYSDVNEVIEWIYTIGRSPRVSVDIEVLNYEIAIIGLANNPETGIAIPLAHPMWTYEEEARIWRALCDVLEAPNTIKIMQNGIFDIHFLASKCGIFIPIRSGNEFTLEDTMMAHSLMYPDFRKGLDFLGSMYCGSQEYWKDMVSWDNIKEDS